MRVLLIPFGSHGDVHPLIWLGQALQKRGHQITLITLPTYQPLADYHRFDFAPIGSHEDYEALVRNPALWHPTRSLATLFDGDRFARLTREAFYRINDLNLPGGTVMVAGSLALSARVAQEKLQIPLATVHLQPISYPSLRDPSRYPGLTIRNWWPIWFRRLLFWIGNRIIMDPLVGPAVNSLRQELDMPRIRQVFGPWRHSPQLILGMFPDWFATARDWPAHFHRVGFPLYDQSEQNDLPWDLRGFLDDGAPPVIVSFGSAMRLGQPYFSAAITACQQLGLRCLVLTRGREQLPTKLPPETFHSDYAPFSQVFPRARLVIHHGGIGTVAQCLAAAVPQLVMPLAFDQPDNAARLERLGVARVLSPKNFQPERIIPILQEFLSSRQIAMACRMAQARFRETDPRDRSCQLIEGLLTPIEIPWSD